MLKIAALFSLQFSWLIGFISLFFFLSLLISYIWNSDWWVKWISLYFKSIIMLQISSCNLKINIISGCYLIFPCYQIIFDNCSTIFGGLFWWYSNFVRLSNSCFTLELKRHGFCRFILLIDNAITNNRNFD